MWLKQFRRKKLQSVLIFLIIMLCSLLITGSVTILTSLDSPYQELAEETGCPDLKIYPSIPASVSGKDWEAFVEDIKGVKDVQTIERFVASSLKLDTGKAEAFVDLSIYNDGFKNVRVIEGDMSELGNGTCAMPSALAYENDIKVGDTVVIPNGDITAQYRVIAIFSDIYSMSSAFTSDILVTDLCGLEPSYIYSVYLDDDMSTDDFIKAYAEKNSGKVDGNFRTIEDCIGNASLTEKIMGGILLGISVCLFIVILLIITYIIKSSLRRDKKNIAVYKAIGFKEKRIAGMYIMFYQSIVFVASIVGSFSSVLVSLAFMKAAYRNLGATNSSADLWQKILCIGIVNLVTIIILLYEFSRLRSVKPVEILSGSEEYGRKKLKERRSFIQSFSPLSLALRMLVREKKRSAIIIITCIVSVYIVNIAVVCLQNIDLISGETNYYWLGIDKHDVTIQNIGDTERFLEICDELENDDRVSLVTLKNYGKSFAIPYHESVGAHIMESYEGLEMDVLEGRNPESSYEASVSNIYIDELGIEIGDYIDISLDEETTVHLLVVGTFQGFYNMGRSIRILGSLLDENNIFYYYDSASIVLKNEEDKEEFIKDTEDEYGNYVMAIDRKNLYENIMEMICEPQRNALLPFVVITVVIGGVNLFYIIYSNNCENRRKNTILKSVGYPASHILKTNLIYVAIIAAASVAISVPALIYLFPKIMVLAMSGFGFAEYKLTVYPLTVVLVNGGMALLFILITLITGKELYKNHLNSIINE